MRFALIAVASLAFTIAGGHITIRETHPSPSAQTVYTTKSGYVACLTESAFKEYVRYVVDKDMGAIQQLMDSQMCFALKSGVKVYLVKSRFTGRVEIRPAGQTGTVWTFTEAIR